MKAAIYRNFGGEINIEKIEDPTPSNDGVIIKVKATGICRSDWHGWMGHDKDIHLPHVPGHEFAGEIVEIGSLVKNYFIGDRVTLPFVCGCGNCEPCRNGDRQICDFQYQPGFTGFGSFAELVSIPYADLNLVKLPESIDFKEAAALGCRFITAFRGLVDLGRAQSGQWVLILGCGGVGLSALMIAKVLGCKTICADINLDSLLKAKDLGADITINTNDELNAKQMIIDLTGGGVHISVDALGLGDLVRFGIHCLRKRGKHIQIGLIPSGGVEIPIDQIIAKEASVQGSHGMASHRYPVIFEWISSGKLDLANLLSTTVNLQQGIEILQKMENISPAGIAVIEFH